MEGSSTAEVRFSASFLSKMLDSDGFLFGWGLRQVGVCLKHLPSYTATGEHYFHDRNVPWQRVISSKGVISPR